MIGPVLLILVTVIYAAIHSLLASLKVKIWARRHIGATADRWYRLGYNVFAVISSLPILALLYLLPDQSLYQISFPWIIITILGQIAGVIIIVIGIQQTGLWFFVGLRQITESEPDSSSVMITRGLYRWVRHPLYTGGLLLIWLMPKMTLNLLTIFIILTIYLIIGAKLEEKRLLHEFGNEYQEYQKRVPMLLPILWRK